MDFIYLFIVYDTFIKSFLPTVFFFAQFIVQLLQILADAAAANGLLPSQSFHFLLWSSRRLYCHNNNNNNNTII